MTPLYLMIGLSLVLVVLRLPVVKGYMGELVVRANLGFLNREEYSVINDIMIPSEKMKTTQIDHLVISRYGLFVIETKNYSGWIFGSETSKNWTQVQYRKKYQFYNPILQNRGHVNALRDLLQDYPQIEYYPVVVFTTRAEFKKLEVTSPVVRTLTLLRFIKEQRNIVLSHEDVASIKRFLLYSNELDHVKRKEHVGRIKEFQEGNSCPRCSGALIERNGKNGRFFGCENFPRCRFTRGIESDV